MDAPQEANEQATPPVNDKIKGIVDALWVRSQPLIEGRLDLLERAAAARPLPDDLRTEARSIAHKLSGSLGMFGFESATPVARELELLLDDNAPNPARLAELTQQLRGVLFPAS